MRCPDCGGKRYRRNVDRDLRELDRLRRKNPTNLDEEDDEEMGFDPRQEGVLVKNIPMKSLSMLKIQGERILTHLRQGRGSRTEGPPVLFFNTAEGQLIVDDGNHRIFQRWLDGEDHFDAYVYSGSYSNYLRHVYDGEEKFNWSEDGYRRNIDETWYHGSNEKFTKFIFVDDIHKRDAGLGAP